MTWFFDLILDLDAHLLLMLNSLRNEFGDVFMYDFSGKWVWIGFYVAIFYALVRRFGFVRGIIYALGAALTVVFADQMCASVIRPLVGRMRPSNLENPLSAFVNIVNNYRGGPNGFPSCHAANTFGLALYTTLVFRNLRFCIFVFLWALVNCWSRMYLGVHYPGDLLVGAIVGCVGAFVCYCLAGLMQNHVTRRGTSRGSFLGVRMYNEQPAPPALAGKVGVWSIRRFGDPFDWSDFPVIVGVVTVICLLVKATLAVL